jgi:hypothetical protein
LTCSSCGSGDVERYLREMVSERQAANRRAFSRIAAGLQHVDTDGPRTGDDEHWLLPLSKYHRDNLLLFLLAAGWGGPEHLIEPLSVFNNGDWAGEIPIMLQHSDGTLWRDGDRANATRADLADGVRRKLVSLGWKPPEL